MSAQRIGSGAKTPVTADTRPDAAGRARAGAPRRPFIEVLREGSPATTPRPPAAPPPGPVKSGPASALRGLVTGAIDAEKKVDAVLAAAARGKTFSPAELLAMQATVFRYSQTVEVVSRVADRLVGAVKQTLGTQV